MKTLDLNKDWKQARPSCTFINNRCVFNGYQSLEIEGGTITPKNEDLILKSSLLRPHIESAVNQETSFLDLGCANFYFGFLANLLNAGKTTGVDVDKEYISAIKSIIEQFSLENIHIVESNIQEYREPHDIVNAAAIIHWLYSCSAFFGSMANVLEFLSGLANRVLFIEWIDNEDAAIKYFGHIGYNNESTEHDYNKVTFLNGLMKRFNRVRFLGNTAPTRELYMAEKLRIYDDTYSGVIQVGLNEVVKTYRQKAMDEGLLEREKFWLHQLREFERVPNILNASDNSITMDYVGERLTAENLPQDWEEQILVISEGLKRYDCSHNDIKPEDILVKNQKLYIVDFGWATRLGEDIPSHWPPDIGGEFAPGVHNFDDSYSLRESVQNILRTDEGL